jgi:[protein-PII] uridylyltransferase
MHSIFTVRELENIRNERLKEELPFLTEIASQIEDWQLLLLAGLLHDIGKGFGKGHAERGASMMPAIARRLGLSDEQADTLHFLVKNHLEMAQVSQKRDLSDPSLINRFAKLIGAEERLKMLVLLTVADQKAVGPEGFNEWKRALLLDLFFKTLRALEKGAEVWAELLASREKTIKSLTEKVDKIIGSERLAYNLKAMPQRFFLTRKADTLARYLILLEKLSNNEILVCEHLNDMDNKNTEFVLSTWDAPGLFYKIAGVLSSNGVNILSADIYTRADGAVLDIFRLNDPAGEVVEESKWKNIEAELRNAFQGKLDVAERLKKRHRPTLTLKRMPYKPPRVEFDLESSDSCSIIEVYAHDRVGLLFDITYALTELGLDIDRAIIATEVDQAADVFYVKDSQGAKITDDTKLEQIKSRLMEVIIEGEKAQIQ